jgi:hypothetical protein
LIVFAKAVFLGSIASILVILFAFRFEGFSRTVFALDGMLLLIMVAGSRFAFVCCAICCRLHRRAMGGAC